MSSIIGGMVILVRTVRSIDRIVARAVIEVGQQHVIADGAEPARHMLECGGSGFLDSGIS
jgi:hypothetical protein